LADAGVCAAMLGSKGVTSPPAAGEYLRHGDVVRFGESEMQVIAVGGHSPGGLCFYSERDKLLLSGDVLFAGSVGRSDFPGGNGEELLAGIRERLFVLPEEVTVIPGHGPLTTIGEEKRHNPFFS
ncbi:MAG: MBL fold metallo-hydrolase, partial [Odoribacter sp.]|nr:MBL fold metallo-hydrolase [Odoribacter sp.]